jgi:hypothetical protein
MGLDDAEDEAWRRAVARGRGSVRGEGWRTRARIRARGVVVDDDDDATPAVDDLIARGGADVVSARSRRDDDAGGEARADGECQSVVVTTLTINLPIVISLFCLLRCAFSGMPPGKVCDDVPVLVWAISHEHEKR